MEFTIHSSCGCTSVEPRKGTVQRKCQQEIKLTVVLPEYANAERAVQVAVESNDTSHSTRICYVSAKCPSPFTVEPSYLDFGELIDGDMACPSQAIELHETDGHYLMNMNNLHVSYKSAYIQVVPELINEKAKRLKVSLKSNLPYGDLYDTIFLNIGDDFREMRVPIHVSHVHPISAVPSTLFLRCDASNANKETGEFIVVAQRYNNHSLGAIHLVKPVDGITVEDLGALDETRHRVRLTIQRESVTYPLESIWLSADNIPVEFTLNVIRPKSMNK